MRPTSYHVPGSAGASTLPADRIPRFDPSRPFSVSFSIEYIARLCIISFVLPRDLIAASSTPLVLSILAENESYGYAIIQRVRELSGAEMQWTDGMLYPVLHRLERDKLIVAEWRKSETGRERKYYRLTSKGGKTLNTEKANWLAVHNTLGKLWNLRPVSI